MGSGLLTVDQFKARTIMPAADVDALESAYPGWLQLESDEETAYMESRLRKRYATPIDRANPPFVTLRWLTAILTQKAYDKRGRDPSSAQDQTAIDAPADRARAELKEAADSVEGLFDLPLRESEPGGSGISQSGPMSYSEASPYDYMDRQREAVRGS